MPPLLTSQSATTGASEPSDVRTERRLVAMTDESAEDRRVHVGTPKKSAVGIPGISASMHYALAEMGPKRSVETLLKLNHVDGFDCPSCAWPDPDPEHRKVAEFCENGAKAVAWEATRKRVDAAFFAAHSVAELRSKDDHSLEHHGRLTEPMYLAPGATHYAPISWDDAIALVADRLRAMPDPNRAVFYTSGRASNEAAFVYQLLARRLGTNNLPDCSNMCHESSGAARGSSRSTRYPKLVSAGAATPRPHVAWPAIRISSACLSMSSSVTTP